MVSIQLNGRLGNQLFQYAFARKLWEQTGRKGKMRFQFMTYGEYLTGFNVHYEKVPFDMEKAGFWKLKFSIQKGVLFALAIELVVTRVWRWMLKLFTKTPPSTCLLEHRWECLTGKLYSSLGLYIARYGYVPFVLPPRGWLRTVHAYGCFECERYFDDIRPILLEEITPREPPRPGNKTLYELIKNTESVCVTIRRGDYLYDSIRNSFYLCTPDYFIDAMKIMKSRVPNAHFIIFSDKVDWCRQNIKFPYAVDYESGCDPVWEKLRLMYSCKHFIISNSTFSWWAQYLSRNSKKVVIAPSKWRNGSYTEDIYLDNNWLLYDLKKKKLIEKSIGTRPN